MQRPKFLTLTLQHLSKDFAEQLGLLRKAFVRLRSHKDWQARVAGGVWVLEYTLDPDGFYHLHLHTVIDSDYFPQEQLANLWTWATYETSCIIWIEKVTSQTARYMAKYAAKSSLHFPDGKDLIDHLAAIKHFRFHGNWKSPKPVLDQQLVLEPLTRINTLRGIINDAKAGHPESQDILRALCLSHQLPFPVDLPPPEPDDW
jgi:hypothetical protein